MADSFDWWSCDGTGGDGGASAALRPTRRQALRGAVAAALAAWLGRSALHDVAFAADTAAQERDVLVTIFLRGGADGLSLVVPHGEDAYYRSRPTLALAKPGDRRTGGAGRAIDLDGFFGLHPALGALHSLYAEGTMACLHAVGSFDTTRSHFEAMATMERGLPDDRATASSGWLARHLAAAPVVNPSPLRAVAFGSILPDSLRGATDVSTLQSLDDFRLNVPAGSGIAATLSSLYRTGDDPVTHAGRETLAVLDTLRRVNPSDYKPSNGAAYPKSDLGNGLRQVACLIRARLGLEVAFLDRGGWDTHVGQGGATGWLATQLQDVGDSLAAFARDLGASGLRRVTVVVLTEFGRRVQENSGLGTDHGRASAMFVLGGGIYGGKVYARWPGLAVPQLEDGIDLKVTTDYRDVLAEIVAKRRGGAATLGAVFPGDTPQFLGIARE
jgi:uncharacterized protein (DUF1501 family)